jgi:hypothetical protein
MAVLRALWEFFADRITFEQWPGSSASVPVEVEVAEPPEARTLRS